MLTNYNVRDEDNYKNELNHFGYKQSYNGANRAIILPMVMVISSKINSRSVPFPIYISTCDYTEFWETDIFNDEVIKY